MQIILPNITQKTDIKKIIESYSVERHRVTITVGFCTIKQTDPNSSSTQWKINWQKTFDSFDVIINLCKKM